MRRSAAYAALDAASAAMCGSIPFKAPEIEVPSIVIATPDDLGALKDPRRWLRRWGPLRLEPAQHLASLEHVDRFNGLRIFWQRCAP